MPRRAFDDFRRLPADELFAEYRRLAGSFLRRERLGEFGAAQDALMIALCEHGATMEQARALLQSFLNTWRSLPSVQHPNFRTALENLQGFESAILRKLGYD